MSSVIKVENLSKSYILNHESKQKYTTFRDAISAKFKSITSGPKSNADLTKEEFYALKDINFEIQRGDCVGVIGRNGAGKSTLLKVLSRIVEPTRGKITITGRVASLLEVGTGFHPELSGRENIFLNGAILGMSRSEIKRKFDEIVDFAEVEKFLDTPVKRYSSGMYVRLAFAVAAHMEPEILVVDEVLAVGDAQFQQKCLGKMNDVSKGEGRTVLFVSHNMGNIIQLCNSCIMLQKGEVKSIGLPMQLVHEYYSQNAEEATFYDKTDADIYIKQVFTCNSKGEQTSNFSHSEDVNLRIVIGINKYNPVQNIGLALLTRDKRRVFTVNKSLSDFYNGGNKDIIVDFVIEGSLIAPMDYSFLVALNSKSGLITYDWKEDICPIRIYDDGTDFAFAEGRDYGCIILKDKWKIIEN